MPLNRRFRRSEACRELHLGEEVLIEWIRQDWVHPIDGEHETLDEEDLARARLILELRETMGVNDESIPIILHLLDQLHALRLQVSERIRKNRAA
jgi:chaperone modulatory protein CbpM